MGKLANLLFERVPGTLPADTERNPKETINVVSLRSGHELEDPIAKQKDELIEGTCGDCGGAEKWQHSKR